MAWWPGPGPRSPATSTTTAIQRSLASCLQKWTPCSVVTTQVRSQERHRSSRPTLRELRQQQWTPVTGEGAEERREHRTWRTLPTASVCAHLIGSPHPCRFVWLCRGRNVITDHSFPRNLNSVFESGKQPSALLPPVSRRSRGNFNLIPLLADGACQCGEWEGLLSLWRSWDVGKRTGGGPPRVWYHRCWYTNLCKKQRKVNDDERMSYLFI